MTVNGKMIYSMDTEQKPGWIIVDMKEITKKGKNKEKVYIYGQMGNI